MHQKFLQEQGGAAFVTKAFKIHPVKSMNSEQRIVWSAVTAKTRKDNNNYSNNDQDNNSCLMMLDVHQREWSSIDQSHLWYGQILAKQTAEIHPQVELVVKSSLKGFLL